MALHPVPANKDSPQGTWKPLKPLLLQSPVLYLLGRNHLLVASAAADWLIDCAHGLCRQHLFGHPNKIKPTRISEDVVIDLAKQFLSHRHRRWEMYEQIGRVGIFLEVTALEREIASVRNDAYDRDDVNDWFAWINGHAVPAGYSIGVIVQALQSSEQRIREHAAAALAYLVRHRGHRCYSPVENGALDDARKMLEATCERLNDKGLLQVYLDRVDPPELLGFGGVGEVKKGS